jgi:hypothetical protein
MDIARVLKDSWVLFKSDWLALIVGSLIAGVLGSLTLGVLAMPLSAAIYLMILRRVREGRPAEIGDVFALMHRFVPLFVAGLLMGLAYFGLFLLWGGSIAVPIYAGVKHSDAGLVLGILLALVVSAAVFVVGAYLTVIWIYVWPLMAERPLGAVEALRESKRLVRSHSFWMHLVTIIVIGLILNVVASVLGSLVWAMAAVTFGLGSVLYVLYFAITPWQTAAFAAMYLQVGDDRDLLPSARPDLPWSAWKGGGRWEAPPVWGPPPGAPGAWTGQPPPGTPVGGPPPAPPTPGSASGPPAGT